MGTSEFRAKEAQDQGPDPLRPANGSHVRPSNGSHANLPNPGTPDAEAIRQQLERILASPPFRNSKRYPALLRYVVEQKLNGASSDLKERTIGVDVFGRQPTYDPATDPVVRISAGEVRKRLAQYYQDVANSDELRVEMPLGSYQPEFITPAPAKPASSATSLSTEAALHAVQQAPAALRTTNLAQRRGLALLCIVALAAIAALGWFRFANRPNALDLFWRPVIGQNGTVLLCLGRGGILEYDSSGGLHRLDPDQQTVAWWDAETLARLTGLLQARGAATRFLRVDQANFSDFQQSPAVLIGAFNDQWTLELMSKMRYTFGRQGSLQWISDRERAAFRDWTIDLNQKDSQGNLAIGQDYAIISRVANPRTGFITVTVAGLWGYGTIAAGRFLTDPRYLEEWAKQSPNTFKKDNLQIVLATEVIQGKSGPPRVVATACW